jgi:hypothetical protein
MCHFLRANNRSMMEELSNITKNCYYGKGSKVIAIDKALRDKKNPGIKDVTVERDAIRRNFP